jgi:hypothetical protein
VAVLGFAPSVAWRRRPEGSEEFFQKTNLSYLMLTFGPNLLAALYIFFC